MKIGKFIKREMRIAVKIASFAHGSLSGLMNTRQNLINVTPSKIKQMEYNEMMQNIPDECLSKFEYSYDDLMSLLANQGMNGRNEKMFPSDIFGLAHLTRQEIERFKTYNLIILSIRNKTY